MSIAARREAEHDVDDDQHELRDEAAARPGPPGGGSGRPRGGRRTARRSRPTRRRTSRRHRRRSSRSSRPRRTSGRRRRTGSTRTSARRSCPTRYRAYMLKERWRKSPWSERDRPQPPVLAGGDGRLVEQEQRRTDRRLGREQRRERDDARDRDDQHRSVRNGPSPRPLGEVAPRRPVSPVSLLSQPRRFAISALSSAGARRRPRGMRRSRRRGRRRGRAPPRGSARLGRSTASRPARRRPPSSRPRGLVVRAGSGPRRARAAPPR